MTARHESRFYNYPPGSMQLTVAIDSSAIYSSTLEPRTSFCLYTPPTHPIRAHSQGIDFVVPAKKYPLLVLIHHAGINGQSMRDDWKGFALKNECVLLSVIFPYMFKGDSEISGGWKTLIDLDHDKEPIRYDTTLLSMIEQAQKEWGYIDTTKFSIVGYSAGGQFAHRFYYLHHDRLRAVSIGAPGTVTQLNANDWPEGVGNTEHLFGVAANQESLQTSTTKVHTVIGSMDVGGRDPWTLTRPSLLKQLHKGLTIAGVDYQNDVVEGAGHDDVKAMIPAQQAFLEKYLRA